MLVFPVQLPHQPMVPDSEEEKVKRFKAFDQETGEVLWEINLGSAVTGFPITYAVDGRQYVAASTSGRASGLTPELRPSAGNNLFVFALPE